MIKKTLPQESKEAQIESSEAGIPPDQNGFHASLSSTVINSNRSIRLLAKDIGVNYQFLANAVPAQRSETLAYLVEYTNRTIQGKRAIPAISRVTNSS